VNVMAAVNIKTAITLTIVGIVIIAVCIPLYLGKIKMNGFYGIRIPKAYESEENWFKVNKYGAGLLMIWGTFVIIAGIVCLALDPQSVLTAAKIIFLSIIIPLVQIFRYGKRV
jgi:uncharacterized membrane protein